MKSSLPGTSPQPDTVSQAGRRALLVLPALGLFAYRPLYLDLLGLPEVAGLEQWFFTPEEKNPLLAIGIAAWLLWRRRERLRRLPDASAGVAAALLLAAGVGLFAWAQLTRAADLLLPSLAANLLAFATATRGLAGGRAALLPAAVLLLGVPIPDPIRDELVWQLQQSSAAGGSWLLQAFGVDVVLGGVLIRSGNLTFTVIESCSGLRGIEILALVAVGIRELFADSGRRQWLLVALAPWLGFALNVVRVASVVLLAAQGEAGNATDLADPGSGAFDHTYQGLAVLMFGTGALYTLGFAMARSVRSRRGEPGPAAAARSGTLELRWRPVAGVLALLAALSVVVVPFENAVEAAPAIEMPMELAGWTGEDMIPDRRFLGPIPPYNLLYRRYQNRPDNPRKRHQVVDIFVGLEGHETPFSSRLFSSKLAAPGRDWSLSEHKRTTLWQLGVGADRAVASRGGQRALVHSWRVRDEGLWRETLRAALALDSGPFRRERPRAVVRLSTPLQKDGPVSRDRAKQVLDRFVTAFRPYLTAL